MSFLVVENDPSYPVQPADIDLEQTLTWAFPDLIDGPASHAAAKAVIGFCQTRGAWTSFTVMELHDAGFPVDDPGFGGLRESGYVWRGGEVPITQGWIVLGEDGRLRVIADFILRCYGRAQKHR